jgi:SH3-like domain-containing protein
MLAPVWSAALAQDTAGEPAGRKVERPGRTGLPLPRFVSLRAAEVNLRTGPGVRYPIDWVYHRRGLPVEVIDEFETWRRIRDHEGTTGWVHQSMLDGRRSILVNREASLLRRRPGPDAPAVALLEPGVIARVEGCEGAWCRVTVERHAGWLRRAQVYGLYPGETLP